MRISDWSSDVCSSDLPGLLVSVDVRIGKWAEQQWSRFLKFCLASGFDYSRFLCATVFERIDSFDKKLSSRCREIAGLCQANVGGGAQAHLPPLSVPVPDVDPALRSEEHTSELQSLMRLSYAGFCLKKKKHKTN